MTLHCRGKVPWRIRDIYRIQRRKIRRCRSQRNRSQICRRSSVAWTGNFLSLLSGLVADACLGLRLRCGSRSALWEMCGSKWGCAI